MGVSAALVIPAIFRAIDQITAPIRGMSKSVSLFTDKAIADNIKLKETLNNVSNQAFNVAKKTAMAGTAILAPLALAVKLSADYEESVASFRTIVSDLNDIDFSRYKSKIEEVGDKTKRQYSVVAQSFETIAGLNAKFAESAESIGAVSEATIILSKASKMALQPAAESLVGIMNQFDLVATDAARTINVLAAGQAVGASSIIQSAEAYKTFGSVAKGANITLEQSQALIQTLGKYSLFGAEAGTKLRGSVLLLQKAGLGYKKGQFSVNEALEEANAKIKKLTTAKAKDAYISKLFGAENITAGKILLNNIELYKQFTAQVTGTSEAQKAAAINSNTLNEKIANLKSSLINMAVKAGEVLIPFLEKVVDKMLPVIEKVIHWIKENPKLTETIVKSATALGVLLLAISAVSTVIGVVTKLTWLWTSAVYVAKAAMALWNIIAWLSVAAAGALETAFWSLTAAILANPIGALIALIVALIAVVIAAATHFDTWGRIVLFILGPLGWLISLIILLYKHWDKVKQSFKENGFMGAIKEIGKVILDFLLYPLQLVLQALSYIPGQMGMFAKQGADAIQEFRKGLDVSIHDESVYGDAARNAAYDQAQTPYPARTVPAINPQSANNDAMVQKFKQSISLDVNIKTPTGVEADAKQVNKSGTGIKLSSTVNPRGGQ